MKILLVEDSPTLRHAMSGYITEAGHEPIVAKSGEESLQILESSPVDMIIMDVEMPGLNGFETTRLMREWLGEHWIPIIFVTGCADEQSYHDGIDAGGDDYLIKPISGTILHAKIKAMERIAEMRNQLNKLNRELQELSQIDSLTKALNRRTFESLADQHWQHANRQRSAISILMLDVDHFKLYNDHYGHQPGDRCLQQIASAIANSLGRGTDLFARYGGEEFIILLPDTDNSGAEQVAEAIRYNIRNLRIRHEVSPTARFVTVSIGVATSNFTTGRTLEQLISHADNALYKAKERGRNQVVLEKFIPHKTVLVVDDNEEQVELLNELLEGHCNMVSCISEVDCLGIAASVQPDLIFLSLDIPDSNGMETCQKLKASLKTTNIPVIVTHNGAKRLPGDFRSQSNADGFLEMPLEREQLLAKINQFLI